MKHLRPPTSTRLRRLLVSTVGVALLLGPVVVADEAVALRHDSSVYAYGRAGYYGSPRPDPLPPLVGLAGLPDSDGYWLAREDGGVYHYGEARWYGSMSDQRLKAPIAGIAATPTGRGYWLFGRNGSVYHFGDARWYGSAANDSLPGTVVAMAPTPTGKGYWLLTSLGGVYHYGDARWYGSLRSVAHTGYVLGFAPTPSGKGYWLATTTGVVRPFGDAEFHGGFGSTPPSSAVIGIARTPSGEGYWLGTESGRAFRFGDATDQGDAEWKIALDRRAVDFAAPTLGGQGYWFLVQRQPPNYLLLEPGSTGTLVSDFQRKLRSLGYWVAVDGDFGPLTEQAVFAFQKFERLPRTGTITVATNERLLRAQRPAPRSTSGNLTELDVDRQIILTVRGGRTLWVFNTSTGTETPYTFEGRTYIAHTSRGRFRIERQIDGLRISHLGQLWRPKYWDGGIAFHGSRSIPPYPASHGCSRLSYAAIDYIWAENLMPLGSDVWSY